MEVNRKTLKVQAQKPCPKAAAEAAEEGEAEAREVWGWDPEGEPEEIHPPQTAPFPFPAEQW